MESAVVERFKNPPDQFSAWRSRYQSVLERNEVPSPKAFGYEPYWFQVEQAPTRKLFSTEASSPEGYLFMALQPNVLALCLPDDHRKRELGFPDSGQLLKITLSGTGYQIPASVLEVRRPQSRSKSITCLLVVKFL